jgi:hypothetical protein
MLKYKTVVGSAPYTVHTIKDYILYHIHKMRRHSRGEVSRVSFAFNNRHTKEINKNRIVKSVYCRSTLPRNEAS